MDLLIRGGCVVTMDPDFRVLDDGAVAVRGREIVAVGPTEEVARAYPAAKTIDARSKVVTPGLVDLHAHSGGALIKTTGEYLDGAEWRDMNKRIFQQFTNPEWWLVEGQVHALERLKAGTTAIFSMVGGSGTRTDDPRYIKATADAFESVGIRALIGLGPTRPPWPQEFSEWENGQRRSRMVEFDEVIAVCKETIRQWREQPGELVSYCTSLSRLGNQNVHDPMWTPEHGRWVRRQAEALHDLMEKYDVGFWTHVYGNAVEYAYDEGLDLLGPKTILSHATGITERSIDLIAQTKSHVAHSPRARRIYAYGEPCPVVEFVDAGVNVALGSDGPPPDRPCDIFLDMKMAMTLQRQRFRDSRVIPPGLALAFASINGYRALGLEHIGGSIEVGKRADIVLVDFAQPHLTPIRMPVHQLVYHATGRDVSTVIVNGDVLIEDKQVLCVDEAELLRRAQELSDRTIADAGLEELTVRPPGFWDRSRY